MRRLGFRDKALGWVVSSLVILCLGMALPLAQTSVALAESPENAEELLVPTDQDLSTSTDNAPVQGVGAPRSLTRSIDAPGAASAQGFVIALDAGHGGPDSGAVGSGLQEKRCCLIIAKAARDRLVNVYHANVYMTREDDHDVELIDRVTNSVNAGADVFVSLHINASGPQANGTEVWYPNSSGFWKAEANHRGKALSQNILNEITGRFGTSNRGVLTRDYPADAGKSYPDGSRMDYYSVIRNSRLYGIPGVIVEHAFISNPKDVAILADDENLRKMGEADADAIAWTYGFSQYNNWFSTSYGEKYSGFYGAWVQGAGGWQVMRNGSPVTSEWVMYRGEWYYLDESGIAATGWRTIDGTRRHFSEGGAASTGWFNDVETGARYLFSNEATPVTGWHKVGGSWYYMDPETCEMATGAHKIGSFSYWLDPETGAMHAGGWGHDKGRDVWYLADGNGALQTGWHKVGGSWYYMDPETCEMATGAHKIGSFSYWLDPETGAMHAGGWGHDKGRDVWYLADGNGALRTGWHKVGGSWYYMDPETCEMATGLLSWDGYVWPLGPDGAWDGRKLEAQNAGEPIMGASRVSAETMADAFNQVNGEFPSIYSSKGTQSINEFCEIIESCAQKEGVRAEVVFAQAMVETGWLRFGGDVKPEQCNFAGIGAVGNQGEGNSFPDVETGIMAQVQHLKAYASTDELNTSCVDPRFHLVTRGIAPNIQDLTGRWATSEAYANSILSVMRAHLGM
ncbi:N-acetylmuramoyl-L-alanine amidase [Olsenella urininfantis]|uniref:N-acetylmuramoyl-L-alanine amidase n=1 Tax=Olsenella urininfantis TaxID=1871033 RepID=UPI00098629CF|nr:N-acetylmuramoyl-L-alanine amidase [Olsenella urininfantis]